MTLSKEKFEELLSLVDPIISNQNTPLRIALSSRKKLEISLLFFGISLLFLQSSSLHYFTFLCGVLKAVIGVLDNYLQIRFVL